MDDVEALSTIVGVLKQLDPKAQVRVLRSTQAFLGISATGAASEDAAETPKAAAIADDRFSRDRQLSAKEFLRDKHPVTDVDRVVCLAYYLTHYRDTPHFKTVDISSLNTEAAQPKFSNASVAVDNARAQGYLVPAIKGTKQISASAERFVELLPDRDAAREAMKSFRPRKRKSRSATEKVD